VERGSGRVRLEAEYYQFQGLWPGCEREGPDGPKCDDDISNNTHWDHLDHLDHLDFCGQDYGSYDSLEVLENIDRDENDEEE